jgi:hypothetical protein
MMNRRLLTNGGAGYDRLSVENEIYWLGGNSFQE